jgi:type 1 fimbria pilin
MKKHVFASLLVACVLAVGAAPAFGDDEGTVSAQVTVAAPCIQITPTQVDFGSLGFSSSSANPVSASRPLSATNCGATADLLVHGSNAVSATGATWALQPDGQVCPTPNNYVQRVGSGAVSIPLDTQDRNLRQLAGGETADVNALVLMPCVGSSGSGEAMTFSYVFTAVLS